MGERYFTFELAGIDSDNFGYVGQRATGPKSGSFAIVGPEWEGDLPGDVDASLAPAPTPWLLILGRTAVDDEADIATVRKLQEQYRLTPLSRWGLGDADRPERRDVLTPIAPEQDPLGPFKTLNAMLEENPPPAHHDLVLNQFARIGIGAGLDVEAQPEAVKQGLIRAEVLGMALLKQQFLSGDWATIINGWRYPPPEIGRYGDDFLLRAADQSLAGIACNDPAEGVYLVTFTDGQDRKLEGGSRYELHFDADSMPPADAFWSLTIYGSDLNLAANPIGRYSIRDTAAGPNKDPDGGLTIYLQAESPGKEKEANWLPCPADGEWFVILRIYLPKPEVIKAEWECPPIERVN
jgi:hypothetical protein